MEEILQLQSVSKLYQKGKIGYGTLQRDLQSFWAKIRKKEDPNSKITKNADKFWALKNVSFSVKQGEAVGIIGRNGAGKSTLLKILSRVTMPTEGEIKIVGRTASLLEVGTGFHPELTGRENIFLSGAILGMSRAQINQKLSQIIAFSECEEFIDTPIKRYSSGMCVKLAFSVAIHLDGNILIFDEVLAVSDVAFREKCLNALRDMALNSDRTILCVSHDMKTIQSICSRCIVLEKGEIVYDGETEKAIQLYQSLCEKNNK